MTVYKMTEVVGTSATSVSDAVRGAIERATAEHENVQWFEVTEIRGRISEDQTPEYQVKVQLGHVLPAIETRETGVAGRRPAGSRQSRSQAAQVAAKRGERGRSDLAKGFRQKGGR